MVCLCRETSRERLCLQVRSDKCYILAGSILISLTLVAIGYGSKRDFEALEANGYDLRKEPTIVLVKYGKVFRGLKVKAAEEAGAIGCLIYSDPGDDGEKTIKNGYKAYPDGPARQPSSVQRGSVQYLSR
jgi:N-acetylated-alpha-linked acidic dipeptidase